LDAHRRNRTPTDKVERTFSVDIHVLRRGVIGFSFDGIELTRSNIEEVTEAVEFVAARLRDDRSDLLRD
jgi:hypothetical protein